MVFILAAWALLSGLHSPAVLHSTAKAGEENPLWWRGESHLQYSSVSSPELVTKIVIFLI